MIGSRSDPFPCAINRAGGSHGPSVAAPAIRREIVLMPVKAGNGAEVDHAATLAPSRAWTVSLNKLNSVNPNELPHPTGA